MEILNQFGINPILLAAQAVNFLILLFILKKFLYKPILRVLEERKKKIEESLKNAEEIELRLQETNNKIDKMMVKAAEEIEKMQGSAKKDIEVMKEEGRLQAEQVALQIIKKGEEQQQAEMEKMKQELMGNLGTFVAMGVEKVTGRVLDQSKQKEIIEEEIKNIS